MHTSTCVTAGLELIWTAQFRFVRCVSKGVSAKLARSSKLPSDRMHPLESLADEEKADLQSPGPLTQCWAVGWSRSARRSSTIAGRSIAHTVCPLLATCEYDDVRTHAHTSFIDHTHHSAWPSAHTRVVAREWMTAAAMGSTSGRRQCGSSIREVHTSVLR
jgi:hypothetical protein